eukprot:scaffold57887_cov63-Phaeocystis_antarctica.AAC.1
MSYMLYVRSVHALRTTQPPARTSPRIVCPPYDSAVRKSLSPPLHAACAAVACRPPVCRPAPRIALYAILSARQSASAFNQPLSFDTSRVTNMRVMFLVHFARALSP